MEIERRYVPVGEGGAEFRVDGDGGAARVYGLAVQWEQLSQPIFRDWKTGKPVHERFARGAFTDVLAAGALDVICCREHDPMHLLARSSSGTLKVYETTRGLEYDFAPPDTEDGRSTVVLARRGDLRGSSFAFGMSVTDNAVANQEWEEKSDKIIRTIKRVDLLADVSPVARPAYRQSKLAVRSEEQDPEVQLAQRALDTWRGDGEAYLHQYRRGMAELAARGL